MSKLNRKTINKYIKSESIEITDQELFNSSGYKDIISDIGKTLTKRYNGNFAVELYWDSSKDAEIAFTDNITNFINTANFITQSLSSFEEKNFSIIGLSCHEFGHQIITDFTLRAKWCKEFENGNIFPYYNSEDKDYIDMKEILEQNNTNASDILIDLGTIINNSLEDLYVDTYMINEYPGDCKKGIILNNKICYDKLPKFDNKRDDIFILCNMILGYCKNKSILYENYAECTEYVKLMKNIVPIIESIFKKNDSEQRWPATNMILILLWPYIKKILKENPEKPIQDKSQDKMMNEIAKNSPTHANRNSKPLTTTISSNDNPTPLPRLNSNINNLVSTLIEDKVNSILESRILTELQEHIMHTQKSEFHEKINIIASRIDKPATQHINEYENSMIFLEQISNNLRMNISDILLKNSRSTKRGLLGKQLDTSSLTRIDKNYFKTHANVKKIDMAVCLLVDTSQSMELENRLENAKKASALLYDFCTKLNIPIMIYGHSTSLDDTSVTLDSYADFESYDDNDKYRIMSMKTTSCNRDGAAIRVTASKLSKRKEKTKLFIIISDGRPFHQIDDYWGDTAIRDIQQAKREFSNKGIIFFNAAIGKDKELIQKIYKNGYLDIQNINDLPFTLTKLISKYI